MNPLITDKSIMGELKSLRKEHHESINGIVNKIVEGIEEKIIDGFVKTNYDRTQAIENRINHFENKILNILLRTEEMVRKSANSINVIVRLIAVSTNIKLTNNIMRLRTVNQDLIISNLMVLIKLLMLISFFFRVPKK